MGTGRVEPEAMRALASRLAASPPALRSARGCAFAYRFGRHCLRRPSRATTPRGRSGLPTSSQAPGVRRRGLGLGWAVQRVRYAASRMEASRSTWSSTLVLAARAGRGGGK